MPYISGTSLVHVPRVKASAGQKAKDAYQGAKNRATHGRAARAVRNAWGNATSEGAQRGPKGKGGTFGKPTTEQRHQRFIAGDNSRMVGAVGGGIAAGVPFSVAASVDNYKHQKKYAANQKTIRANNKRLKESVTKSRAKLITDVGTKSGRLANKRYPGLNVRALAGGAAMSAGVTGAAYEIGRANRKNQLDRQQKRIATQQRKLKAVGVNKSAVSAFGIEH